MSAYPIVRSADSGRTAYTVRMEIRDTAAV
jgi:hypothetical protein